MTDASRNLRASASVVIPCRDEQRGIVECVASLLDGDADGCILEVLVVDGMSSDGTRDAVLRLAERRGRVRLIDNPDRFAPHAMNRGIREARGRFVVRADAHAVYPPSYVRRLLEQHDDPRVANVGGTLENLPGDGSLAAEVISGAMGSLFGVGISFRTLRGGPVRDVDTVPFGCWRRDLFGEVGTFDEAFVRAQDLEFNIRCRRRGYRIRCIPSLRVAYRNRSTFPGLFRMVRQTGYWKVRVNARHHSLSSLRQLVPLGTIVAIVAGVAIAVLVPRIGLLGLIPLAVYALGDALASAAIARTASRHRAASFFMAFGCFPVMHASYAWGYAQGIAHGVLSRRSGTGENETTRT